MKYSLIFVILLFGAFSCSGPLYQFGKVRPGNPPVQTGVPDGFWSMEKDVQLHYLAKGQGRPVLVLHGGPGMPYARAWTGLKSFEAQYRFYYYHQRGSGRSTRPIQSFKSDNFYQNMKTLESKPGLSAQIGDIERIRRLLGQERIILVGHSFGGFIAALYAAEFPERVEKLILLSPAGVVRMPQKDGGLYEHVKRLLKEPTMRKRYDEYLKRYLDYGNIFKKNEAELTAEHLEFFEYYRAASKIAGLSMPGAPDASLTGGWVTPALFFSMGMKHDFRPYLKKLRLLY